MSCVVGISACTYRRTKIFLEPCLKQSIFTYKCMHVYARGYGNRLLFTVSFVGSHTHSSNITLSPSILNNTFIFLGSIVKPFKPSRCIEASFYISENIFNSPTIKGFRMNISMKLVYQKMTIFCFHSHQIIFIHYKSRIASAIHGL